MNESRVFKIPKHPIIVQFVYHPSSEDAANVADYLHSVLNDDPAVPGLRIPTCFPSIRNTLAPPEPELADEADRVFVVLLADDHLAANAQRVTENGITWGDYIAAIRQFCDESPMHKFMPIQITENSWPIDTRLNDLSFLRAWTIGSLEEQRKFIARRLVHTLTRQLLPRVNEEETPPLTIFLSHTKLDLVQEPQVVKSLLAHLTVEHPEKTWFDSGEISSGSRFATEIENGVTDAALLAVITDSYSSRAWCRREVLLAKRHQRPVVVVNSIQEREIRSFPYAGNVPVIRWNGHPQDAVDLLLRENLRHTYSMERLDKCKEPDDFILPTGPELVTVLHRGKDQKVLYPDPPLGLEERAVLSAAGVTAETPLERHSLKNDLRERNLVVALSVSEAENLGRFGLRKAHFDSIFLEISRYLLLAGIKLSYGGHLNADGYTWKLVDLLRDPVIEHLRGEPASGKAQPQELITYIPWPMPIAVQDQARLGPLVEVRPCERPAGIDESLDTTFVQSPIDDIPVDTPNRRFAWSQGLTAMREQQTTDVAARVIIGGRLSPGFKGRVPGILEEAILSIRAERPVYLIGAFGGCAQLVIDALEGVERPELTWNYQKTAVYSEELRRLYRDRGQVWEEYEEIGIYLRDLGFAGLKNGLTTEENRELGTTRSSERIIALILRGIQNCYPLVSETL
jgi:hypothetical protein